MADSTTIEPVKTADLVQEQDIIIEMPSGNSKIVSLKSNIKVNLGKFGNFKSNSLIGKPFGLSYEIYNVEGDIRPVGHIPKNTSVEETSANNQNTIDNNAVQRLTHMEIEKLKEEGMKGTVNTEEIIQRVIESHGGFENKTEYSKAKYIERKKKKFTRVFTPIRPTIYTISNYFFTKNPDKIKSIRTDTLSQLLNLSNVRAHSKMLVVDDTQGLLVASCLERMGGFGQLVALHEGESHNYDILRYMNFPESIKSVLYNVPLDIVNAEDPPLVFEHAATDEEIALMDAENKQGFERRKAAYEKKLEAQQLLFAGDFDGLIISSNFTPESVIKMLIKYICGSRPIVVYSFSKEVLLSAAYWMRKSPDYLNVEVTESWLREHQVLPGRMHPQMMTSAGGGYLLTALRAIDCPFDPSVKKEANDRNKKRKTTHDKSRSDTTTKVDLETKNMDISTE